MLKLKGNFMNNELLSALIFALVASVINLINVPKLQYIDENGETMHINRIWMAVKTFVLSFIVFYALIYFFASDQTSSILSNMKQGDPNF
jgi:hypothetical protein